MKKFRLSENIDPNKVFIINRSELEGRLDSFFYINRPDFHNTIRLSKIAKIKGGKRIPKDANYSDIDTPNLYLRVTDIDESTEFNYLNFKSISDELYEKLKRYEVFENELIISIAGTVGKTKVVKNIPDKKRVILTENCVKILTNSDILPQYLNIVLQTNFLQKQIELSYIQTTIPKLGIDKILGLKIPQIPPLEIQQQIVDLYEKAYTEKQQKEAEAQKLLDSIDDYLLGELGITLPKEEEHLTQNNDKNNSYNLDNDNPLVKKGRLFLTNLSEVTGERWNSDYYKKYYSTFMQKIHNKYNSILLGEIVECIFQGIGKKEESYPNVKLLKVKNILKNNEIDYKSIDFLDKVPKDKILKIDDIITPFIGEAIKLIKFSNHTNNKDIYSIDNNTGVIRINKFNNPKYICEYLNSSIGAIQINRLIGGGGVPFMGGNNFKKILICLPPLEKQNEIVSHITQIRSKANELKQEGKEILEQAKQEVEQMILGN